MVVNNNNLNLEECVCMNFKVALKATKYCCLICDNVRLAILDTFTGNSRGDIIASIKVHCEQYETISKEIVVNVIGWLSHENLKKAIRLKRMNRNEINAQILYFVYVKYDTCLICLI